MPNFTGIPSKGGFSGIAGWTPSIANQWADTDVSSGALGKGASMTFKLELIRETTWRTKDGRIYSKIKYFLPLWIPRPSHLCKTGHYVQQLFWIAVHHWRQIHILATTREWQTRMKRTTLQRECLYKMWPPSLGTYMKGKVIKRGFT